MLIFLLEGPQTRISKSRVVDGQTSSALAWRGNSVPGMYLVPRNVIKAAADMGTLAMGGNPVKGHTTSTLINKSYINIIDILGKENANRIPTDVRRRMEDTLDAEYVPFYFHDMRTNEIIAFHAFLNSLSDSYSAGFSSNSGYGRIDPVRIYKSTSRSLSLSFYIAATSKEDFDEMWFKINKLTSLVYPQWSKGTTMKDADNNQIIQPFSQIIAATPLVRLRVGDVIKSNYSRFNLSRLFGVGESEFKIEKDTYAAGGGASGAINTSGVEIMGKSLSDIQIDTVFNALFGSPLAISPFSGDAGASAGDRMINSLVASTLTLNGFVNPLGANLILKELRNPDDPASIGDTFGTMNIVQDNISSVADLLSGRRSPLSNSEPAAGYTTRSFPILKPSVNIGYTLVLDDGTTTKLRTTVPYRVLVTNIGRVTVDKFSQGENSPTSSGFKDPNRTTSKVQYTVKFFDVDAPNVGGKQMKVWHEDLMPNPDAMFSATVSPALDTIGTAAGLLQTAVNEKVVKHMGIPADALRLTTTDAAEFMHPGNNSITRAFENSGGRGLAGVVRSLSYDWIDSSMPWEVDWGSRGPKVCKVSINFDVIHDIPPGLDSSGYNRAPIYNVGKTMNDITGDPNPDGGLASQQSYTRAGVQGVQQLKKED